MFTGEDQRNFGQIAAVATLADKETRKESDGEVVRYRRAAPDLRTQSCHIEA
jgi:hypothetical protein